MLRINLTRKLNGLKTELDRVEKLLAAGGFRDADGDWNTLGDKAIAAKKSDVERLNKMILDTDRQIQQIVGSN